MFIWLEKFVCIFLFTFLWVSSTLLKDDYIGLKTKAFTQTHYPFACVTQCWLAIPVGDLLWTASSIECSESYKAQIRNWIARKILFQISMTAFLKVQNLQWMCMLWIASCITWSISIPMWPTACPFRPWRKRERERGICLILAQI
jgi:hypothetical protein